MGKNDFSLELISSVKQKTGGTTQTSSGLELSGVNAKHTKEMITALKLERKSHAKHVKKRTFSLKEGLYHSLEHVVESLNHMMKNAYHPHKPKVRFYFNTANKHVFMKVYEDTEMVNFHPELAQLLHFDSRIWYKGSAKFEGKTGVDIHRDSLAVYVYCDLVEHRPVGDVMAPLLRIVPTVDKSADIIHRIYEKPHYISLAKRQFNTVEILLATDNGKPLQLESGTTVVTLHLRPKRVQR